MPHGVRTHSHPFSTSLPSEVTGSRGLALVRRKLRSISPSEREKWDPDKRNSPRGSSTPGSPDCS
ncbi:hypothetical protein LEMLEM_LOCUS21756, partial [Lemmus lemmus]